MMQDSQFPTVTIDMSTLIFKIVKMLYWKYHLCQWLMSVWMKLFSLLLYPYFYKYPNSNSDFWCLTLHSQHQKIFPDLLMPIQYFCLFFLSEALFLKSMSYKLQWSVIGFDIILPNIDYLQHYIDHRCWNGCFGVDVMIMFAGHIQQVTGCISGTVRHTPNRARRHECGSAGTTSGSVCTFTAQGLPRHPLQWAPSRSSRGGMECIKYEWNVWLLVQPLWNVMGVKHSGSPPSPLFRPHQSHPSPTDQSAWLETWSGTVLSGRTALWWTKTWLF